MKKITWAALITLIGFLNNCGKNRPEEPSQAAKPAVIKHANTEKPTLAPIKTPQENTLYSSAKDELSDFVNYIKETADEIDERPIMYGIKKEPIGSTRRYKKTIETDSHIYIIEYSDFSPENKEYPDHLGSSNDVVDKPDQLRIAIEDKKTGLTTTFVDSGIDAFAEECGLDRIVSNLDGPYWEENIPRPFQMRTQWKPGQAEVANRKYLGAVRDVRKQIKANSPRYGSRHK